MKPFGTKTAPPRAATIPEARLARVHPSPTHRLDEDVMEAFTLACSLDELEAAADLMALMQRWQSRRVHADEQEKRFGRLHLRRMLGELERRHVMRGAKRDQNAA